MTPEEIAAEIDVLLRMRLLGEMLMGKGFFDTLAYVQIKRRLAELTGAQLVAFIKAENLKEEESKKSAEMRAAQGI